MSFIRGSVHAMHLISKHIRHSSFIQTLLSVPDFHRFSTCVVADCHRR